MGLPSRNPDEAAKIVNAVVESYIDQHNNYHKNANRALKINMETELGKLEKKIQDVEDRLLELVDKGKVTVKKHLPANVPGKEGDAAARPLRRPTASRRPSMRRRPASYSTWISS